VAGFLKHMNIIMAAFSKKKIFFKEKILLIDGFQTRCVFATFDEMKFHILFSKLSKTEILYLQVPSFCEE
jgi:hypothetical protein